tara:strand:+ start:279 stop:572 length:294 start_codon:yes stop_codon:yes gene_type:complete
MSQAFKNSRLSGSGMIISKRSATGSRLDFMHIPPDLVDRMKVLRLCNNSVPIMQMFGISDNSWRQIRSGKPLRYSVAARLIERLQTSQHLVEDRNRA